MKEYKKYLSAGLIDKVTAEGYQGFLELTTVYPITEARKNGEVLLYLLKVGLNVLEIDEILEICSSTIERRILEHLREKEMQGNDTFEDCKFLFEEVKGLEYFNLYRRFLNSNSNEAEFKKREGISKDVMDNLKIRMNLKGIQKYQEEVQKRKAHSLSEEQKRRKASENPRRSTSRYYANILYLA